MNIVLNLDLPQLTDNSVWFANAAAFNNYFKQVNANFNLIAGEKPTASLPFSVPTATAQTVKLDPSGTTIIGTLTNTELQGVIDQVSNLRSVLNELIVNLQAAGYLKIV